jgi:hypothetical protein
MHASRFLPLALLCAALAGCATSSNIEVLSDGALAHGFHIAAVTVRNDTGETFDIDIEGMLQEAVESQVAKRDLVHAKGAALGFDVAIIQYEKGNAFKRWLMPGAGKTILSVEATFIDSAGKPIAQSQATRSIGAGGGYTIGAWKHVFGNVAEQLVDDLVAAAKAG